MMCVVGLAVDKDGVLYIADGVTLRTVDQRGRIATLIGSHSSSTSWRPLLCYRTVAASQVRLCVRVCEGVCVCVCWYGHND